MIHNKLNLGCGKCYLPPEQGWINVDLFTSGKADAYYDVTNLPYEKESFSLLYCSHILEHCHRFAIVATLASWRNYLKPGGILRLAVPDFDAIVNWYADTGILDDVMGLLYGRQDYHLNRHTVVFNHQTLTRDLKRAGFEIIRHWNWRTTEHADYDDFSQAYLPKLDKEHGMLMSLNLEAVK
jgi:predicted SAM-dependent methyltransferase